MSHTYSTGEKDWSADGTCALSSSVVRVKHLIILIFQPLTRFRQLTKQNAQDFCNSLSKVQLHTLLLHTCIIQYMYIVHSIHVHVCIIHVRYACKCKGIKENYGYTSHSIYSKYCREILLIRNMFENLVQPSVIEISCGQTIPK